jgi:Zn finger protein HypA/HybF involved in hydrogenase expression
MDEVAFFRCASCNGVVSMWDIKKIHGCPKCKGNKLRHSDLSLWEKIIQVFKHPQIWRWGSADYFQS